jgi:hypothetical protein
LLKYLSNYLVLIISIFVLITPAREVTAKDGFNHHLVIHVDDNDKGRMNLSINNAANVTQYY